MLAAVNPVERCTLAVHAPFSICGRMHLLDAALAAGSGYLRICSVRPSAEPDRTENGTRPISSPSAVSMSTRQRPLAGRDLIE